MLQQYIRALVNLFVSAKAYHGHFLAALLGTQSLVAMLRNINRAPLEEFYLRIETSLQIVVLKFYEMVNKFGSNILLASKDVDMLL